MPYTSREKDLDLIYATSFRREPSPKDDWQPYEDTPEEYIRALRNPGVMRYAVKTIRAGRWLECKIYPIWSASRDVPRAPKEIRSTAAQQTLNERNALERFARLVAENFEPYRDHWCTFTSDDNHLVATEEEGMQMLTRFVARLKYLYRQHGVDLKYAYGPSFSAARDKFKRKICDAEGRQLLRPHIHIVLSGGVTAREILARWQYGSINQIRPLQPTSVGYQGLAHYVGTQQVKKGRRRFAYSKNLRPPRESRSLSNPRATKGAIQRIAGDEHLRADYFEKLYGGRYRFVDCRANWNHVNDGTYLYCRMELKGGGAGAVKRDRPPRPSGAGADPPRRGRGRPPAQNACAAD